MWIQLFSVSFCMYHISGRPNEYADGCPTPHPPLQIFEFILRRFLGIRFSDDPFSEVRTDLRSELFLSAKESKDIFTEDERLSEGGVTMFLPVDWDECDLETRVYRSLYMICQCQNHNISDCF